MPDLSVQLPDPSAETPSAAGPASPAPPAALADPAGSAAPVASAAAAESLAPATLAPPLAASPPIGLITDASPDPRPAEPIAPRLQTLYTSLRQALLRQHVAPQDTDDIIQEALFVLISQWQQVAHPRAYLFATARRMAALHLRTLAAERYVRLADQELPSLVVQSPAAHLERCHDARRLLSLLPPRVLQIAQLHFDAGLSHRQIAAKLDLSEDVVRQHLSRGLRRVKRELRLSTPAAR